MEDSFKVRVDKIFGSLSRGNGDVGEVKQSPEGVDPPLWCLTDEEVEKRKWNRRFDQEIDDENDDHELGPVALRDPLESDLLELSEGEEDEEEEGGDADEKKRCRIDDNDFDVESNIGRDTTLDLEEEEDENDKLAVGIQEQNGDPLFVKDAQFSDYGIDEEVITSSELPNSFHTFPRDSRADITAAKLRLKEDDDQFTSNPDSTSQLPDNSIPTTMETEQDVKDSEIPKSILKKPEISLESRSQKRVRFMTDNTISSTSEVQQFSVSSKLPIEEPISNLPQNAPGIPDYLRNPTKYTRYDFDSAEDINDQSNSKALNDLFQFLRQSNEESSSVDDAPADISKPVVFTPKLKRGEKNEMEEDNDVKNKGRWSVDVTVEGVEECEASAMEEDEPSVQVSSLQKPGRKYRARSSATDAGDN